MAAVTALTTQLVWGLMECLAYKALLDSDAIAFPMEYSAVVSYIWLKEAFLALFNTWAADNDIFSMIVDGGIAYEMCRPVSLYGMWFSRSVGGRVAEAILRCIPVLLGAILVPAPYKISGPFSLGAFGIFVLTMILALGITVSFCMVIYMLCFFTISSQGWRMLFMGAVEFLAGSIIPLPFIPEPYRNVIELLPFASMHNVPFRIYSGDLLGYDRMKAIILQVFWVVMLNIIGTLLCKKAERRVVVQGG
jgi:ABC-2 type transport system permease protein